MISVFGSKVGIEELDEIKTSIDSQWLGIGPKTVIFEKMMARKLGIEDFTAVDSGSNALFLAIKLLNLPAGSEIIMPAITWVACANAAVLAGCKPVFCDVDYDTVNITGKAIDDVENKNVKAIMIVHYGGLPVMLMHRLPIISDAAHAVDSAINGQSLAWLYDISVYSFDSVKNIVGGELGGICSTNPGWQKKTKDLRYCGLIKSGYQASTEKARWWEYELIEPMPKIMPNDLTCSVAIAQLKKITQLQARRKEIWNIYQSQLRLGWIINPPAIPDGIRHSYFTYFIKVINGKRDELAYYLLDKGIYTTVRYQPLHLINRYRRGYKLPVAEKLNNELLNIPLHPNLSDKDVDYIIDTIKKFE